MQKSLTLVSMTIVAASFSFLLSGTAADPTKKDDDAKSKNVEERIEIRLARAHLKLSEFDLENALYVNKRIGRKVFSSEYIERLLLHVDIDRAELEHLLSGGSDEAHEVCLRRTESALRLSKRDLAARTAIQARLPSRGNALAMERAKISVELATHNLERAKELDTTTSTLSHLQWQIDELRHQVLLLQAGMPPKVGPGL